MTKALTREEILNEVRESMNRIFEAGACDHKNPETAALRYTRGAQGIESAISAIIQERDEAVKQADDVRSWIQERWSVCRTLDTLTHDRDEWKKRAGEAEKAILDKAIQHREDHCICIFCGESSEDGGLSLFHQPDCITIMLPSDGPK